MEQREKERTPDFDQDALCFSNELFEMVSKTTGKEAAMNMINLQLLKDF